MIDALLTAAACSLVFGVFFLVSERDRRWRKTHCGRELYEENPMEFGSSYYVGDCDGKKGHAGNCYDLSRREARP